MKKRLFAVLCVLVLTISASVIIHAGFNDVDYGAAYVVEELASGCCVEPIESRTPPIDDPNGGAGCLRCWICVGAPWCGSILHGFNCHC